MFSSNLLQLEGSIQISSSGIVWKRSGGGRTVEIPASDIREMMWSETPRIGSTQGVKTSALMVLRKGDAGAVTLIGFPRSKVEALSVVGQVKERALSLSGHNWGNVEIQGPNMVFKASDGSPLFVFPLSDVLQAQHGRDEVTIQLPVDDTTVDRNDDALAGISFYVPKDCEDFVGNGGEGDEVGMPGSRKLFDIVKSFTVDDVGAGDVIASFDSVGVLLPRGRFDIEMYPSSFHLLGQAHDFRVQYQSILRIFVLPKANAPQTLVAIALDPPIRKGQTTYTMVLCQFHNDEEMSIDLQLSDEALKSRNEKGAKLTKEMAGPSPDVFAKTLRGLSGAKLTRTGAFRDASGEGHAVRCSYKNDDGYLYPLERAFFYVLKPPLLIPYDDIHSLEFMRQATGITAAKTFDLLIRMKSKGEDLKIQQYMFRGIPRSEWTNLFEWIQAKNIRIENLQEVQRGPSARPATYDEDMMIGIDPGLAGIDAQDSDEDMGGDDEDMEDEDFEASESSDGDDSGVSDEEGAPTVPENAEKKKEKKEPKRAKEAEEGGKKKRKKKDKNAPKKNLSAFMFYSNAVRDKVKEDNPGIAFTEVAKKIGEMWKELGEGEKGPYEEQAAADKERYAREMENYKASLGQVEEKPDSNVVKQDDDDDDFPAFEDDM